MNHLLPVILLNPEKNCKNIGNYATEQQKCPKMDIILKNLGCRQKYTVFWFSLAFLCSILGFRIKSLDKTVLKMWSQNLEKKVLIFASLGVFLKAICT